MSSFGLRSRMAAHRTGGLRALTLTCLLLASALFACSDSASGPGTDGSAQVTILPRYPASVSERPALSGMRLRIVERASGRHVASVDSAITAAQAMQPITWCRTIASSRTTRSARTASAWASIAQ